MIDAIELYMLILTSLTDLDLGSRSQGCKKAKTSAPVISQKFSFDMDSIFSFYRVHSVFNGEIATLVIFKKQTNNTFSIGLCSDLCWLIFFKLDVMIETTKLYFLISVWLTLTFIQDHSCVRYQRLWCPFPQQFCCQFGWNSELPQPVGFLKLTLNLFV